MSSDHEKSDSSEKGVRFDRNIDEKKYDRSDISIVSKEETKVDTDNINKTIDDDEEIGEAEIDEYIADEVVDGDVVQKSIFDILDAPRSLAPPIQISETAIKLKEKELGLIRLCWPDKEDISYENVFHSVPVSYRVNNFKEKYILLQAENFRRQFSHRYHDRKLLLLIGDNAAGQQKMVCTAVRPTTVPHMEIQTWESCASFVSDHLVYEPLLTPTSIFHT